MQYMSTTTSLIGVIKQIVQNFWLTVLSESFEWKVFDVLLSDFRKLKKKHIKLKKNSKTRIIVMTNWLIKFPKGS